MQPNPSHGERKHCTHVNYTRQCLCSSNAVPGTVTLTSLWSSGNSRADEKDYLHESDLDEGTDSSERPLSDCNDKEIESEGVQEAQDDRTTVVNVHAESTANDEQQQQQQQQQQDKVIHAGVIVRPQRKIVEGTTASYTYFHLDKTRSIRMFVSYLMSLDGGKRSESIARQYASNLSKYLYFASQCANVKWKAIVDREKIDSYLEKLTSDGICVSGRTDKLASIRHGIQYCLLVGIGGQSLKCDLIEMDNRLKNWMKVMRRMRNGEQMRREEELSESPPDITSVSIVMSDSIIGIFVGLVHPATKGESISISDEETLVSYLLAVLMYGNAQRPAAVLNADIEDYRKRKTVTNEGDSYVLIKVSVFQKLAANCYYNFYNR